jgi:hypothetical protein
MKGLQIFVHSVRQVTGNLNAAIRVSGILYLVQFGLSYWLGRGIPREQDQVHGMMMSGEFPWILSIATGLITLLTSVWIAVGWHRYVLRVEEPGILPVFLGDRLLGYFGKSLLIGLILVPIGLVLGFIGALLLSPLATGGNETLFVILMAIIVYLPLGVIGMRLSTILPGVALEAGQPIGAGWVATKGQTGNIVAVVLLGLVMVAVVDLPAQLVFEPGSSLVLIWRFLAGWLLTMVSVSILTTLYGHYIEKRALL